MARQINLVNPALRKTREFPSALAVVALAAVATALVGVGAVAARVSASARHAEAETAARNLKQAQDALLAATQKLAARKPDAAIAAELDQAREQLRRQQEVGVRLESGDIGNTEGFSEYLRGFARQVPQGLWLTGFTIGAGGHDMEVRGRMLSPSLLTEYVRRLNAEHAFRGVNFSGLEIRAPHPEGAAAGATRAAPNYTEFVLSTVPAEERR